MTQVLNFNAPKTADNPYGMIKVGVDGLTVRIELPDGTVQIHGTAPATAPTGGRLDPSYFTSDDLRAAIKNLKPSQRVTCDGTELNPGVEPTIKYGSAPNGYTVNVINPDALGEPVAVAPVKAPVVAPPPPPAPPAPEPVQVLPERNAADQSYFVQFAPQARVRTQGFGTGTVSFMVSIPSDLVYDRSHIGYLQFAEMPGSAVLAKTFTVFVNGVPVYNNDGENNSAPKVDFTIGNPAYAALGAGFNVQPGDSLVIKLKNGFNATQQPGDVLFDFASPSRY